MRIVYLLTQDIESPSGLGRYFPWAKGLAARGFDVQIIALHPDYFNLKNKDFLKDGVQIRYVGPMHVKKSQSSKTYYSPLKLISVVIEGTIKLTTAALSRSGDAIFIGKPHPMNSIAGLIVKQLRPNITLLVDLDDFESASNRFQGNWQKKVIAWFEKTLPLKADIVTTNTYEGLQRLVTWGVSLDQLIYVPNGIDPDRFQPLEPNVITNFRKELGLLDSKIVSFIGSLSLPSHPVDLLLVAFAGVQKTVTDSKLLLVGGGEDVETLERQALKLGILENVIFTGRIPPEKIQLYYSISDVTVDPVRDNEAAKGRCPLKMFESWISRTPFVTMDVGDRNHLLGNPPAGLLIPPEDDKALAEGLITLLLNPSMGDRFRNRGSQAVISYIWDQIVVQFENKFKLILKKNN